MHDLLDAVNSIEITWLHLAASNPLVGHSLAAAALRSRTGASVVALLRNRQLIANPKSATVLMAGDRVGLIGEPDHIEAAEKLLSQDDI